MSETSVDEVFMHHFEKMSSASGGFASRPPPGNCPWALLGGFRSSVPLIANPWKKSCRLPWQELYQNIGVAKSWSWVSEEHHSLKI